MDDGFRFRSWNCAHAMDLDIPELMQGLAARRPVFHSEADFQFELAWHLREAHPLLAIRLEYPLSPPGKAALDILVRKGDEEMAIELKYPRQRLVCEIDGERFTLKAQEAQDLGRYAVLKDVERMERFVATRPAASAAVVVLSNEPGYWRGQTHAGTADAAFALHEGRIVTGRLDWGPTAGIGTKGGGPTAIDLKGRYVMNWRDYSRVDGPLGKFRYLCVPISPR